MFVAISAEVANDRRVSSRFMEDLKLPQHKIEKICQTRWLSRRQVIARILEQRDALRLFFSEEAKTDKTDGASIIYETMRKPGAKHILLFLDFVLRKVDNMNIEFQAEDFRLHKLFESLSDEYRNIMSFFVKESVMASVKLNAINPAHPGNYKKLKEVHFGGCCEAMLLQEPLENDEERFRSDALSFLVELCKQI